MTAITEEFLVLTSNGSVLIIAVGEMPPGTKVGPDAMRLRVNGPVWVKPPRPVLTPEQWELWQNRLREAGFSVSVEPFWTSRPTGIYLPLEEVVDDLLGQT
jgi:hypothetical protein